jgi:hypothetical protein
MKGGAVESCSAFFILRQAFTQDFALSFNANAVAEGFP